MLVNQLLNNDLNEDLITLITHLAIVRCRKVRVCDEDDDLSLYLLEALVTGKNQIFIVSIIANFCFFFFDFYDV